jgi:cell division protein FtsZ
MMGTASAKGENACVVAAQKAISSALMESGGVRGARGVLINITASSQLGLHEVNEACTLIGDATENEDAQVNFGVVLDESMGDEIKITVIATGFVRENLPRIERRTIQANARAAAAVQEPERVVLHDDLQYEPQHESEVETAQPAFAAESPQASAPERLPAEHLQDEQPIAMAAAANSANGNGVNGHAEKLFDDLDVPAIMRRSRRMVQ